MRRKTVRRTCYSLHAIYKPNYDSAFGLAEGKCLGERRPVVQKVEQAHMSTVGVKECIEFCTDALTSIISDATF